MPRRTRLCNRWAVEVEYSPSSTRPGHGTPLRAGLAESVDAVHSKCIVERRAGSSPASGTNREPRPHRGRGSVVFQVAAQLSAVAYPRPSAVRLRGLRGSHLARCTARSLDTASRTHPATPFAVMDPSRSPEFNGIASALLNRTRVDADTISASRDSHR